MAIDEDRKAKLRPRPLEQARQRLVIGMMKGGDSGQAFGDRDAPRDRSAGVSPTTRGIAPSPAATRSERVLA